MARGPEQRKPANFRLPLSILRRIDLHAARMERQMPGIQVSKTGALLNLLETALGLAEASDEPGGMAGGVDAEMVSTKASKKRARPSLKSKGQRVRTRPKR